MFHSFITVPVTLLAGLLSGRQRFRTLEARTSRPPQGSERRALGHSSYGFTLLPRYFS